MESSNVLTQVAELAGIANSYTTAWGSKTTVSDDTLTQLLTALGYDTSDETKLLACAKKKHTPSILAPAHVFTTGSAIHVPMHLGASARMSEFSWRLETEDGGVLEGYLQSQIISDDRAQGGPVVFVLPADIPLGYHKLLISRRRRKSPFESTLIVAPKACYKQPSLASGEKSWGLSIQLYTLRTEHNWGMGDFGDLKQLVADISARGGNFIGLNPIHALFPANPEAASPYSPSSRRWLNLLYIDVTSVAEFSLCSEAQQFVGNNDFQQQLHQVRETEWVDYSAVAALKMAVLPLLFNTFKQRHLAHDTSRAQAFAEFVQYGGDSLLHQAAFDAMHAHLHAENDCVWGWPAFPKEQQQFAHASVKQFIQQHFDEVQLYMYLQWIANEQLKDVQAFALEQGMSIGLYRDLAVGVAEGGAETWADQGVLCQDVSIGAPPDILGPLGQNWGLPPLNPSELKATGYDAFIQLLRANMQHCGALRIDHVLGLLRLWWIPKGQDATQGAYMYYPVQDMLAILALESHQHQCTVIGEDLGTVPDEIVSLLDEAGIHSYKVFFFETAEDGGFYSPSHYKPQSMATLCTHDMPTLRGFWHCEDLKLGKEVGLYPEQNQLNQLFDDRLRAKQGVLSSVAWHGNLAQGIAQDASHVSMDEALSNSLQLHLAAGSSSLLSLQLEDWLAMEKPVNIPGTVDQYPNWRRKLSITLEELFTQPNINALTSELTAARKKASQVS